MDVNSDIPSRDYHDYVIKNGCFIGRFEEMYKVCENPWPETEEDLNAMPCSVRTTQLIAANKPARVLSVGSGKGLHLNWLAQACPGTEFEGCEISETAVRESLRRYPHLSVNQFDAKDFSARHWDFDLILFREVIWYLAVLGEHLSGDASPVRRQADHHRAVLLRQAGVWQRVFQRPRRVCEEISVSDPRSASAPHDHPPT